MLGTLALGPTMIKHVVMFAFKPECQGDLGEAKKRLEALVGKVPELRSMEVGLNFLPSERAMDLVLTSVVEDERGLEAYRVHPAHQEVVEFLKARSLSSKAVDYHF